MAMTQLTTTPRGLKGLLKITPRDHALFAWGPPGIGKTDTVSQVSTETGESMCEVVILGQRPPEDVLGLPDVDRERGESRYLPFPWLKRLTYDVHSEKPDEGLKATLFFDEFNAAIPRIQLAAQRILLERRLDDRALHPGVRCVAAGNRVEDACFATEMPASVANRQLHVEVEPSLREWLEDFAAPNGLHHVVTSYLRSKESHFYTFDPAKDRKAFASPRSWTRASEFLYEAERGGASEMLLHLGLSGWVGPGVGGEVLAHWRLGSKVPSPDTVAKDPDGTPIPEEPSLVWYTFGWLASDLAKNPIAKRAEAFIRYVLREDSPEFRVAFIRDALLGSDKSREMLLKNPKFIREGWDLVRDILGKSPSAAKGGSK